MQIVTEFKPLQKVAYDHIKELVLSDSLSFNHIYSETSIAQDIGISRTPVRDALHFLSQEGLVDILPSKGFVLQIGRASCRERV